MQHVHPHPSGWKISRHKLGSDARGRKHFFGPVETMTYAA